MKKNKNYFKRNKCRLCNSSNIEKVIDFPKAVAGEHLYRTKINISNKLVPIDLYRCDNCYHIQVIHVPHQKLLWGKTYTYLPRNNPHMFSHFEKSVNFLLRHRKNFKFAFEIGSNDGLFLEILRKKTRSNVLGIDPSIIPVKVARQKKIKTILDYFNESSANKILSEYSKPDLIIANNVFAHLDDLRGMIGNIHKMLSDDGLFIFEVSYVLDILKKKLIGTIIHEHLSHHSVYSLKKFLNSFGFNFIDAMHIKKVQGGALIGLCKKNNQIKIYKKIEKLIKIENRNHINSKSGVKMHNKQLQSEIFKFSNLLKNHKKFIAYGAARSAPFILKLFKIEKRVKFIVDDNKIKLGKYLPLTNAKIISSKNLLLLKDLRNYTFIVTGWHQTDRILKKLNKLSINNIFVVFPDFKIIKK